MGGELFDACPEWTEHASDILGYSIKRLCLEDPDKQLGRTEYTQPALYVVNALTYQQKLKETGKAPDFVAGHSLGEYNALQAAGAFSFEQGLELVKKRGELMSRVLQGAMAAIVGPSPEAVAECLEANHLSSIDIANFNSPRQTVIAGSRDDLKDAQPAIEAIPATFIPLNVSGAFHSRYMAQVASEFEEHLGLVEFSALQIPVIANVTGLPYREDPITRYLAKQITHPVRWLESMRYLLAQGETVFEELGVGDVLTKLMVAIRRDFGPKGSTKAASDAKPMAAAAGGAAPEDRIAVLRKNANMSCFVIGEGTLLILCAQQLVKASWDIRGVISPDPAVHRWAEANGVPWFSTAAIDVLRRTGYDYLFSVANRVILSEEILSTPGKRAINFHDAPLPKYAGVHATSWALLHGEREHGITWHTMVPEIDGGEILKQVLFPISPEETVLSLNARCFGAGVKAFAEMIPELAAEQIRPKQQDFSQRSYFPLVKKPTTAGILSWQMNGQDMEALVRALDFGSYPNSLATAKLTVEDSWVVVDKLEALASSRSVAPPGTVTAIRENELTVATASCDVVIRQLRTVDGEKLSIPSFVARFGLRQGYRFTDMKSDRMRQIATLAESVAKQETFWRKRLACGRPLEVAPARSALATARSEVRCHDGFLPLAEVEDFLKGHESWRASDLLIAAYVIYLSRVSGAKDFSIGLSHAGLRDEVHELESFFVHRVPLVVDVDVDKEVAAAIDDILARLHSAKARRTYLRDLGARHGGTSPVRLAVVVEEANPEEAHGGEFDLKFRVSEAGDHCRWFYNPEVMARDDMEAIHDAFNAFLSALMREIGGSVGALSVRTHRRWLGVGSSADHPGTPPEGTELTDERDRRRHSDREKFEQRAILLDLKEKRISPQEARQRLERTLRSRSSAPPSRSSTASFSTADVRSHAVTRRNGGVTDPILEPVAVIGISGRFPGAKNIREFWANLQNGTDSVNEITRETWDIDRVFDPIPGKAGKIYARHAGFVDDVDRFDPLFFNISPKEAERMEPQYRLLLQEIWKAVEDAGYKASSWSGKNVGLFVGGSVGDYSGDNVQVPSLECSRIAYLFDWRGPCICLETACSSALVAVHEACLHIATKQVEMAVVGGMNLMVTPNAYRYLSRTYALSAKGKCFSFDKRADGTIFSESVCAIVLKPLSAALSDNDPIYGVIRGSGINYDGKTNGISAPSGKAQMELQTGIYRQFNIDPERITMVEAHGTGTTLGDPIEVNALVGAFKQFTSKKAFCALGSVKSNIGHTGFASGLVGMIKALLSINYGQIPATINYEELNPAISLDESPFYINATLRNWPAGSRVAAISSFGFSGTNAHVVIEEGLARSVSASEVPDFGAVGSVRIVPLSAKNRERLREAASNLLKFLRESKISRAKIDLADLAYTLQVGREEMRSRAVFLVHSLDDLVDRLAAFGDAEVDASHGERWFQGELNKTAHRDGDRDQIRRWHQEGELVELAKSWVTGVPIDWALLHQNVDGRTAGAEDVRRKPRRISLPTYPFAEDRYWKTNTTRPREISARELEASEADNSEVGTMFLRTVWEEKAARRDSQLAYAQTHVFRCGFDGDVQGLPGDLAPVGILDPRSFDHARSWDERFEHCAVALFEAIQEVVRTPLKGKVLIQVAVPSDGPSRVLAALSGLLKTAQLEHPRLDWQVIAVEGDGSAPELIGILRENAQSAEDRQVRYQGGKRWVASLTAATAPEVASLPWKNDGVYWLTGGAGGLGLLFAAEIAERVSGVTLILTGRSALSPDRRARIAALEKLGARVAYKVVDVSDRQAVEALVAYIQSSFGALHGVIHAAGLHRRNYILKKTAAEFREVLAPKVGGVVNVDETTKGLDLDFFVMFSSVAGEIGNAGQSDYATGNAFMDAFADYRNALRRTHQRSGRTLSISWPLWRDGGMQVDEATERMLRDKVGMVAMRTTSGIAAFYRCLASSESRVMVVEGLLERMKQKLLPALQSVAEPGPDAVAEPAVADPAELLGRIQQGLIEAICETMKLEPQDLDVERELSEYGFDSITFTDLAHRLNRRYGLELTPTIFFDHPTISGFAQVLAEKHGRAVARQLADPPRQGELEKHVETSRSRARFTQVARHPMPATDDRQPIAIVGMSGKFPMAADLDEYWANLRDGRDCIEEIPKQRWDWKAYYGDPRQGGHKTKIKWGGFIDGVDEFDPQFFGISSREAEIMDPHQRLLMTHIWLALEDAGYSAASISGSRTGIFVATASNGYDSLIARSKLAVDRYSATGIAPSMGPNRMSYFLNIHGPSEPVDTACSSSLVAIHRAIAAIEWGDCDQAMVGGVNTLVTPDPFIRFDKEGLLCEDGRCKSFSNRANGYVRGEGVGILFLKRLSDAESAGDHIYGLVRSSGENHGGRAVWLTAPNTKAQADLLVQVYKKAGIDPSTVGYIEAHGTGTELGDSIEVNALKTAFAELSRQSGGSGVTGPHCGIGSVKTNIGHVELAAGVASVIKVLLQFKHRRLVESLHCKEVNSYIDLRDSPFYIVQASRPWEALRDDAGETMPLRAGVSSFGFGGVNAHVVLEEYRAEPRRRASVGATLEAPDPAVVVLSGRSTERVREYAGKLLRFIQCEAGPASTLSLEDLAYTLQVGRDAMGARLGLLVHSTADLAEKLQQFVDGKEAIEGLYFGQVKPNRETSTVFGSDEERRKATSDFIERKRFGELLDSWVQGRDVDWNQLHGERRPRRISAPTYPFARERYWIESGSPSVADSVGAGADPRHAAPSDDVAASVKAGTNAGVGEPNLSHGWARELSALDLPRRAEAVMDAVRAELARLLSLSGADAVAPDRPLSELGLDSITALALRDALGKRAGTTLPATLVFDYPTPAAIAKFLLDGVLSTAKPQSTFSADDLLAALDRFDASVSTQNLPDKLRTALATKMNSLLSNSLNVASAQAEAASLPDRIITADSETLFELLDNTFDIGPGHEHG